MSDPFQKSEGTLVSQLSHKDWFLPAIESEGSVRKSFDAVLKELKMRGEFIVQLRERLTRKGQELDRLSTISREAKELENTLRFRLGILQPERPAAWFRKAPNKDFGPFRTTMLMAPVFCEYETSQVDDVVVALKRCWEQSQTGPIPSKQAGESLWGILLGHHAELNAMAELSGLFEGLRLDKPCQDLPAALESASLRAFLVNVCGEFVAVKDRLQLCFDHLWGASEKLWAHQRKQNKAAEQKRQSTSYYRSERRDPHGRCYGERSTPRRELGISFAEMEALRYMGFRNKPDGNVLKQRYYEMAKELHPDREGGNEESFKMLNRAYQTLKTVSP